MNNTGRNLNITIAGITLTVIGPILAASSLILFYLAGSHYGDERTALIVGGALLITFGALILAGGIVLLALNHRIADAMHKQGRLTEVTPIHLKAMGITFASLAPMMLILSGLLVFLAQGYTSHEFIGLIVGAIVLLITALGFALGAVFSFKGYSQAA